MQISKALLVQQLAESPPHYDLEMPDKPTKPASVLLLCAEQEGKLKLLLTRRSAHLRLHAGQVSLPGGKPDRADTDEFATALREASEEIGLDPQHIDRLGYALPVLTSSNYIVNVAVACARTDAAQLFATLSPNLSEVSDIWWGDADHLLNLQHFNIQSRITADGKERQFYVIEDTEPVVWGATAAMFYRLAEQISKAG